MTFSCYPSTLTPAQLAEIEIRDLKELQSFMRSNKKFNNCLVSNIDLKISKISSKQLREVYEELYKNQNFLYSQLPVIQTRRLVTILSLFQLALIAYAGMQDRPWLLVTSLTIIGVAIRHFTYHYPSKGRPTGKRADELLLTDFGKLVRKVDEVQGEYTVKKWFELYFEETFVLNV